MGSCVSNNKIVPLEVHKPVKLQTHKKWNSISTNQQINLMRYKSLSKFSNETIITKKLVDKIGNCNINEVQFSKWNDILDGFTDGICITDMFGTIIYGNTSLHILFSHINLSLISKHISVLIESKFDIIKNNIDRNINSVIEFDVPNEEDFFVELSYNLVQKAYNGDCRYMIAFRNISERKILEKQLQIEHKKNSEIISALLPQNIINRIKNGEKEITDTHKCVTIGFCDIVNFTQLTIDKPNEIARILTCLFNKFDELAINIGITKMETVGDCYMVACGIFNEKDQTEKTIRFMYEAIKYANNVLGLDMRAGIHCGQVDSAVIGIILPHFSIFGPAVNMAARLESNSKKNKIHVSNQVIENINKTKYLITDNGKPNLKGFGANDTTYFIELYSN
jgi:class 3 adenylate cyclase